MKDSQDWLDEILGDYGAKRAVAYRDENQNDYGDTCVKLKSQAKSAIREHFLKEALEMINGLPKLILKGKFEDDMGLFGDYIEVAELRNKFNDKYKED